MRPDERGHAERGRLDGEPRAATPDRDAEEPVDDDGREREDRRHEGERRAPPPAAGELVHLEAAEGDGARGEERDLDERGDALPLRADDGDAEHGERRRKDGEERLQAEARRVVHAEERVRRGEPEREPRAAGAPAAHGEERAEHEPRDGSEADVDRREAKRRLDGHEAAERAVRRRLDERPRRARDGAAGEPASEVPEQHRSQSPGPNRQITLNAGRRPLRCTTIAIPIPRSPQKKTWIVES
jgi:hypothetical protein